MSFFCFYPRTTCRKGESWLHIGEKISLFNNRQDDKVSVIESTQQINVWVCLSFLLTLLLFFFMLIISLFFGSANHKNKIQHVYSAQNARICERIFTPQIHFCSIVNFSSSLVKLETKSRNVIWIITQTDMREYEAMN